VNGTARFPREARILGRGGFQRVFAQGRRGGAFGLTLLVAPRPAGSGTGSRLGVSLSRKFGNAVRRNRARRLLRETFRRLGPDLPGGLDIVALPQKERFPDDQGEVTRVFLRALERARAALAAGPTEAPR